MYTARINVPGYLPTDDDPPVFDTAAEAWWYLAEERERDEDNYPEWADHGCPDSTACGYSETHGELVDAANFAHTSEWDGIDTIYGPTPGYDGSHDLGLAYSVSAVES